MTDQKNEVKSKVDIVEVILGYVPLKKAGRNFSGLCPFHSEKTPSFMVSPDRQVYKCFGCGESGDVFSFLEKIEGVDFRTALEELADKVGVKLKSFAPSPKSQIRDKIIEVNKVTGKFYSYLLEKHKSAEVARRYLLGRGIKRPTWGKFGIGYSPAGWEATAGVLAKRGFSLSDLSASGLIIARAGGQKTYFDRFRNRLMFPMTDSRGTIVGFSARVLGEASQKEPKYMNSPQTEIFEKGAILYGLSIAREEIRKKNEVILVEGEFDVMSVHQIGILNVVATKGTALTEKQVAMLSRMADTVILCFDTDLAGDAASRRGIEMLDAAGVTVKVVSFGKFKDPDEFCQKDPAGFKKAIDSAINVYDYFIKSAQRRFDATGADGKKKIGQELVPMVAKISDDLVRAHYIGKLARILDLDILLVSEAVSKKLPNVEIASSEGLDEHPQKITAEEYFLALLVFADSISADVLKSLKVDDFQEGSNRELWKWIHDIMSDSKNGSLRQKLSKAPAKFEKSVDNLYLIEISPAFSDRELWEQEVFKTAARIRKGSLARKLAQISKKIKEAEEEGNLKTIEKLNGNFRKISEEISTL